MKKLLLLATIVFYTVAQSQEILTKGRIDTIWSTGQVPKGNNFKNSNYTWYPPTYSAGNGISITGSGKTYTITYNGSASTNTISINGAGTNTVTKTGNSYTITGASPTIVGAGSTTVTATGNTFVINTPTFISGVSNASVLTGSTLATNVTSSFLTTLGANPTLNTLDGNFTLKNTIDNTKVAKFDAADFTTGTTRTFKLPNLNGGRLLATTSSTSNTIPYFSTTNGVVIGGGSLTYNGIYSALGSPLDPTSLLNVGTDATNAFTNGIKISTDATFILKGIDLEVDATTTGLSINGTGIPLKITNGNQGAGKVLTSDANGNADWANAVSTSAFVTTDRTLTINGTTQDLSVNRTFNVTSVTGNSGSATTLASPITINGIGRNAGSTFTLCPLTTNGDLSIFSGTLGNTRFPNGTFGQILTSDPTIANGGMSWSSYIYSPTDNSVTLNLASKVLHGFGSVQSVDIGNRLLYNSSGSNVLDWTGNGVVITGTLSGCAYKGQAIGNNYITTPWISINNVTALLGTNIAISGGGGSGDLKADGTVPMTANWSAGNFSLTHNGVILGNSANNITMGSSAGQASTISTTSNPTKGTLTIGNTISVNEASKLFRVGTPTTTDNLADALIGIQSTSQKGLVIQYKASPTANALEVQSSTGTNLASINQYGIGVGTNATTTAPIDLQSNLNSVPFVRNYNYNAGSSAGSGFYISSNSSVLSLNSYSEANTGRPHACWIEAGNADVESFTDPELNLGTIGNTSINFYTNQTQKQLEINPSGLVTVSTNIKAQHIIGGTSKPTIAAGVGAGTSPNVSITTGGTDISGIVNITTGTTPTGSNAIIATITFNVSYGTAPIVIITPANSATSALSGATNIFATSTTTTFLLNSGTSALTGSTAYKWYYHVLN